MDRIGDDSTPFPVAYGVGGTGTDMPQQEKPVEILVKGLPLDAKEIDLAQAYGHVALVLRIRFVPVAEGETERKAYLQFGDRDQALRAAQAITSFQGSPVVAEVVEPLPYMCLPKQTPLLKIPIKPPSDPTDPLAIILARMRNHPDPKALIASALKGIIDEISGLNIGRELSDEDEDVTEIKSAAVLKPEMASYLDEFPSCKALMVKIRSMPNNDNKTPIAVLHEYAKRTGFKVDYDLPGDAHVGPFFVECKLTSSNGSLEYAVGRGEAPSKKEARQIASASAIEMLLRTVREVDFMRPARSRPFGMDSHFAPRARREGGSPPSYRSESQNGKIDEYSDIVNYPGW